MPRDGYVWVKALTPARKAEITAACERLIAEMKARFLPVTRPHRFNYPVDIRGRWRGESYSFLVRFRSDEPDAIEPEFDAPFAKHRALRRPLRRALDAPHRPLVAAPRRPHPGGGDRLASPPALRCGRRYEAPRAGPLSRAGRNRRRDPCTFLAIYTGSEAAMRRCRLASARECPRSGSGQAEGFQALDRLGHEAAPPPSRPGRRRLGKTQRRRRPRRHRRHPQRQSPATPVVVAPSHEADGAALREPPATSPSSPSDVVEVMECLPIPER